MTDPSARPEARSAEPLIQLIQRWMAEDASLSDEEKAVAASELTELQRALNPTAPVPALAEVLNDKSLRLMFRRAKDEDYWEHDRDKVAALMRRELIALLTPWLAQHDQTIREELETEVVRLQRARIGDSEIIGRWMCQAENAESSRASLAQQVRATIAQYDELMKAFGNRARTSDMGRCIETLRALLDPPAETQA